MECCSPDVNGSRNINCTVIASNYLIYPIYHSVLLYRPDVGRLLWGNLQPVKSTRYNMACLLLSCINTVLKTSIEGSYSLTHGSSWLILGKMAKKARGFGQSDIQTFFNVQMKPPTGMFVRPIKFY